MALHVFIMVLDHSSQFKEVLLVERTAKFCKITSCHQLLRGNDDVWSLNKIVVKCCKLYIAIKCSIKQNIYTIFSPNATLQCRPYTWFRISKASMYLRNFSSFRTFECSILEVIIVILFFLCFFYGIITGILSNKNIKAIKVI